MAFRELPFKIVLMQEFFFIHILHLRRVCLGEVHAEVAIFAAYIANYAKYSKLDSVFKKDEIIIPMLLTIRCSSFVSTSYLICTHFVQTCLINYYQILRLKKSIHNASFEEQENLADGAKNSISDQYKRQNLSRYRGYA